MSALRVPSLLLSALLQFLPIVRVALPATECAGSILAIVCRWGAGMAALLGSVQAVSGASTVITTGNVSATNGVPTSTRLLTSPETAGWWSASGLPPGVNLSQVSSRWYLDGTPTAAGAYQVNLVAKKSATAPAKETTSKTITFTVVGGGGGNAPPVANAQSVTTAEDTAKFITLTGSDSDGDSLTFAIINLPSHGTLSGSAPNLTYTPAANYHGSDSFTFKVNDGTEDSPTVTVSVSVTAINDTPVANGQGVTTAEGSARAITLSGSDADGDSLTYAIVSLPAHGSLSGTAPNVTYTPAANYSGPDSFTFRVYDGMVNSATATVSITVTAVNSAPVATPQSVTTAEDTAKSITLSGTDDDGDALTYTIVAQPSHGSISGTAPNVTYTPAVDYSGSDSFTFGANDGTVDSATATVSINVSPVNDAPLAFAQSVNTPENLPQSITLTGSDVEGSALSYIIVSQPVHGSLGGTAPNLIYTPAVAFSGGDGFTFKVNDGGLDSAVVTVSINVSSVNSAPVANGQNVTANEGSPTSITLTGTDADGDSLTYTVLTQPAKGSLSGTVPNLTYTPNAGASGVDDFTFKANDGTVDSAPATISINISAANHVPVAGAQSVTTAEDTARAITLSGSDLDGDPLTFTVVGQPAHGSLSGSAPNVTYTPAANFNGSDSFTFMVNDGQADSAVATVSITVTAVNDPPVAMNLTSSTTAGEQVVLNPLAGSSDPDGDALGITAVSPTNGTAVIQGTSILFTPAQGFVGTAYVGYTISDGQSSSTGLISVIVSAASNEQFSITEGSLMLNPQTGLTVQQVAVTNIGSSTVAAVRLTASGLRSGVALHNASGNNGGDPTVQHDAPLNPGQGVMFALEFYVPDRMPFTATYSADAIMPRPNTADPEEGNSISRAFLDRSNPAGACFTIEFPTVPGRTYTIIYSDDSKHWKVATPSVKASASVTQWHDDGPPKTISRPGSGSRFYRVLTTD